MGQIQLKLSEETVSNQKFLGEKNGRTLFDFEYRQCKNGEGAISLIQIAD